MRKSAITLAVVLLMLLSVSVASADTSYGGRGMLSGSGYFTSATSTTASFAATTRINSMYAPANLVACRATMYRGGIWMPPDDYHEMIDWDSATADVSKSGGSGTWQGIGWHYGEWVGNGSDSCSTYDTAAGLREDFLQSMTDHHQAVRRLIGRLQEHSAWAYYNPITSPELRGASIGEKAGGALDKLFHTELFCTNMEAGDYIPFLLLSPSGKQAMAVFEKPRTGTIRLVSLRIKGSTWEIGESVDILSKTTD